MGLWGLGVDFVDSSGTPSPTVSPLTQGNQDILYGFIVFISEAVAGGTSHPRPTLILESVEALFWCVTGHEHPCPPFAFGCVLGVMSDFDDCRVALF
jgi:hypothetical protein